MTTTLVSKPVKKRRKLFHCPNCNCTITSAQVAQFIARQGAGRKPELKPCEFCGKEFGTAAMRKHIPRCPKRKT